MPNGAVRHTWFMINGRTATCDAAKETPEEFQAMLAGATGHMAGVTVERISPDDVSKDPYGDIRVNVRGAQDGQSVHWEFYTSRDACTLTAKAMKPEQAPSGDIN
jgi:hypothetical protein